MKEQKNIDELFKKSFQDFEATPSPEVWDHIEAALKKEKKERKVIPLWWKLGGVAAVLALLLTFGKLYFNSGDGNEIVIENPETPKEENPLLENTKVLDNVKEGIVEEDDDTHLIDKKTLPESKEVITKSNASKEHTLVTSEKSANKSNGLKKQRSILENDSEDAIAEEKTNKSSANKDQNPLLKKEVAVEDAISETKAITQKESGQDNLKTTQENSENRSTISSKEITAIPSEEKEAIAKEETKEILEEEEKERSKKKSIFDAIEEEKEEALTQLEETKNSSWELTPNAGPVYYNSIDGGSSIDPSFADNPQSGNVSFSYGVQVAYNINEKFSIRTGVNNINVGYSTGGVEVVSGPQAVGLKSVDYNTPEGRILSVFDRGTLATNSTGGTDPYSQLNLKSTSPNVELTQNISYYEVPFELKYALFDKKFGVNMIGGFSTLFLGNNEVVVNDGDFRTVLGEANNLNTVSFSTNIGLGFNYNLSKRLTLNVEPMFKYQLNPYTNSSANFRPYYLGVFSGVSFKF